MTEKMAQMGTIYHAIILTIFVEQVPAGKSSLSMYTFRTLTHAAS
jgi:hypothetical protein